MWPQSPAFKQSQKSVLSAGPSIVNSEPPTSHIWAFTWTQTFEPGNKIDTHGKALEGNSSCFISARVICTWTSSLVQIFLLRVNYNFDHQRMTQNLAISITHKVEVASQNLNSLQKKLLTFFVRVAEPFKQVFPTGKWETQLHAWCFLRIRSGSLWVNQEPKVMYLWVWSWAVWLEDYSCWLWLLQCYGR